MAHAELRPEDVLAIVDTREQLPWTLAPLRTAGGTLDTGDYSVAGLEHYVAIERKSLTDYLGCIGGGRERFERELHRMVSYPVRAVIVEAGWADLESGQYGRSQLQPAHVIGSTLGWICWGVPFIMAGTRERADLLAARLLFIAARRYWRIAATFCSTLKLV